MVDYNGTYYAYVHTLQGDIGAIIDNTGTKVVEYGYDAWGKPTKVWSLTHPSESTLTSEYGKLAQLNPFRYRGYVWDEETGLYYLRSRYYDPAWGRFLNADSQVNFDSYILDHAVFSYGRNNPITLVDPSGHAALSANAASFIIAGGLWLFHQLRMQNLPDITRALSYAVAITYNKAQEWASQRERAISIEARYKRTSNPVYFDAVLLGADIGVAPVGEPYGFEVAVSRVQYGNDIWTADREDAYAAGMAASLIMGGRLIHAGQDSERGAFHYHLYKLNKKEPVHIFYGEDYINYMGFEFGEGDFV